MGVLQGIKEKGRKVVEALSGKSVEQIQEADSSFVQGQPERKETPIPEALMLVFDSEAFKKLSLSAQQYLKTESLKLYTGKIDKAYIETLKKLEYSKSKTQWQNAIKVLSQKQKKTATKMNANTLSLFPIASTGLFLTDFEFLTNNIEFKNLVSAIKGWKKDLKWFIDAHNPNHEDYNKYYQGKPNDNESIINVSSMKAFKTKRADYQWFSQC